MRVRAPMLALMLVAPGCGARSGLLGGDPPTDERPDVAIAPDATPPVPEETSGEDGTPRDPPDSSVFDVVEVDTRPPLEAGACAPVAWLADDFSKPAIDPILWRTSFEGSAKALIDGGRLVLGPLVADASAKLSSVGCYDLREGSLAIEAVEVAGSSTNTLFGLTDDEGYVFADFLDLGTLRARLRVTVADGGAEIAVSSSPPAARRFWRFREASGKLHWDTSPDGAKWTELAAATSPPWIRRARVLIWVGELSGREGKLATLDNLRGG